MKALSDDDPTVRVAVVEALGKLGDIRATQHLIERLDDADPRVPTAAARALGALGDRRAVGPLIAKLTGPDRKDLAAKVYDACRRDPAHKMYRP